MALSRLDRTHPLARPPWLAAGRSLDASRLRTAVARSWPSLIAGATAIGLIVELAWDSGGYFPSSYLFAGAVALAVVGVLLLLRPPHYTLSTEALVALAGLLGLAAWTSLSATWSPTPETAIEDMERTVTYAALFGLGLVAAGSGRFARRLVGAVLLAGAVIVAAGLASRLYPDVIAGPEVTAETAGYRLAYPLDYWNAFGAMAALVAVVAVGVAADPGRRPLARSAAAALAVPLTTAMYLSLSRGSWLALGVGLAVLLGLSANRWSVLLTLTIVGGAVAISVEGLQDYPGLVDAPGAGAGQLSEGRAYDGLLAWMTVVAGAVQGVVAAARASPGLMVGLRRVVRPLLVGIAGLAGLAALGLYALEPTRVESEGAERLVSFEDFLDEQWDDFMQPGAVEAEGTERLTTARGTRSDLYRVAIDGFEAHPFRGDGSGGFQQRFIRDREVEEEVRDAHSLYLETLSELGIVGFAFLALFIGSLVAAAVRSRLRPGALGRSQAAAVSAGCAVWIAHAGVDWDWQIPALTGLALVLAAALFPEGRKPARRLRRRISRSGRRGLERAAGRHGAEDGGATVSDGPAGGAALGASFPPVDRRAPR